MFTELETETVRPVQSEAKYPSLQSRGSMKALENQLHWSLRLITFLQVFTAVLIL